MSHVGVINYWYHKYGMGFIKSKTVGKDVWIHYSVAPKGIRFQKGMQIKFDLVATARGPQAANISILGEAKVSSVPKHVRLKQEREVEDLGLEPVAWALTAEADEDRTSQWHFINPMFPDMTLCGLSIPTSRVVEGGAYPTNCSKCQGRAKRRARELA